MDKSKFWDWTSRFPFVSLIENSWEKSTLNLHLMKILLQDEANMKKYQFPNFVVLINSILFLSYKYVSV